jgi:tripartite ATP-independent transporter DctM subunit
MKAAVVRIENLVATLALGAVMALPLSEIVWRKVSGQGILGAGPIASWLTMWVGLLGGAIAARDGKLLTLATGEFMPKGRLGEVAHLLSGFVGAMVAAVFVAAGWTLVETYRAGGDLIATLVPMWIGVLVLPVGFGLVALRLAWRASPHVLGRLAAALGIVLGLWLAGQVDLINSHAVWPWFVLVVVGALFGGPIFALLGGLAVFATFTQGNPPIELLIRAQDSLTKNESLSAIPLFTLAGLLLAEGQSSTRLLRLLRACFGWMPGGSAIAAATLCAFFTLFTGGSGVTILVLGGLLLPAMLADKYRERFSIGLLTASGSLGLLFPLSLPLMLFSIVASSSRVAAPMEQLFVGGLLPGLMMLGLVAVLGVREAVASKAVRTPFEASEAVRSAWNAKFEVLLPVIVLGLYLSGVMTLTEAAPVAALYALLVQRFVHHDLPSWKDVVRVMSDCVALVGSILLILAVASGLTDYFVDARVTQTLVEWTTAHIHSQLVFLLCLNLFLLLVGTVMDIFSAIVVVVPLILPVATQFGLDPVHLGIIFVANLELGFLHPPLGLNLLLASMRFKKPVLEVTWATLPMLGVLAVGVLLITYVPWLTLGLVQWMR